MIPLLIEEAKALEGDRIEIPPFSGLGLGTHYVSMRVHSVDVRNPRLYVDDGFRIRADLSVRFSTNERRCNLCLFSISRIRARGTVVASATMGLDGGRADLRVALTSSLTHYDSSTRLPDNFGPIRRFAQRRISALTDSSERPMSVAATRELNRMIAQTRTQLGPGFAKWLSDQHVVQRLANWVKDSDPRIVRGNSLDGGERFYFSVDVDSAWLRRPAPRLTIPLDQHRSAVGIKMSYAFINRFLEILLAKDLSDVLGEFRAAGKIAALDRGVDSMETLSYDDGAAGIRETSHKFRELLRRAGLTFDDTLAFKVPVRVRPKDRGSVIVMASDVRMLKGTNRDRHIQVSVSAEGMIGFGREAKRTDVDYLVDHLALEVLGPQKRRSDRLRSRQFRSLVSVAGGMLRGEHGTWTDSGAPAGDLIALREAIADFLDVARMEVPFDLRIGDGLVVKITRMENDIDQYALVLSGNVG